MADLVVVGQDPRFGGGVAGQLDAFLDGARALGRTPSLVYDPHPTFDGRRLTIDRIEAVRQWRSGRRLETAARTATSLWVVSTLATHGLAAARSGRPYSCWIGTSLEDEWRGRGRGLDAIRRFAQGVNEPLLHRIERHVLRGAAHVYATSDASRSAVARAGGFAEAAVGILPIPVDVDALTPEPDELWLARLEAPVLTFVGRADDPRKNLPLLLEALPAIRARLPGARLRLIGQPPREVPDGVEALGEVGSIASALRESSLFLLPSWQEGFGIVAAEALACGVPVVTTPSGGPEHLVRASGGGRVLAGWDATELANVVTKLLGDADSLSRMRAAGRDHVVREHAPSRFRSLLANAL